MKGCEWGSVYSLMLHLSFIWCFYTEHLECIHLVWALPVGNNALTLKCYHHHHTLPITPPNTLIKQQVDRKANDPAHLKKISLM